MTKKQLSLLSLACVALTSVLVWALIASRAKDQPDSTSPSVTPLVSQSALDSLPKKSGSTADLSRLDSGVIPPTNSWLSGMVLQASPLPVYPMPLSFLAKDSGFEISLPVIRADERNIFGQHTPNLKASIESASKFKLSRFDKVSSTLTYYADNQEIGQLTLAAGSPFVFLRAKADIKLSLNDITAVHSDSSDDYLRFSRNGHDYVVVAADGATISRQNADVRLNAPENSLLTFYALPGSGADSLRPHAGNELSYVKIAHGVDGDKSITGLNYVTANSKPTVFVPMAYAEPQDAGVAIATYSTIYGDAKAYEGNSFRLSAPITTPSNQLPLAGLPASRKQDLIRLLAQDASTTKVDSSNPYFAGKQLARVATLLDIARQLGQEDISGKLTSLLLKEFDKRLGANYFYYDDKLRGVASQQSAFGSEDFNDHHFHYGYFIYAASILGRYEPSFVDKYKDQINLLVADIASYEPSDSFPVRRNFDPYAGHSWAAGLSPFADGNNQESSSEAINAWNGIAMWADLIDNSQLKSSAVWMLSQEAATAKAAWRTVAKDASYLKNYRAPLTSLSFGGKRTYSTFFSDEASAKLGIQLIPMSPVMRTFSSDKKLIDSVVSALIRNGNYNVPLGDYVLMYKALSDPQEALRSLSSLRDSSIDDGNSKAYLHAWVYSLL